MNVVLRTDPDQMALTIHGKKRNIHRNDFLALAENCGIPAKVAEKMIGTLLKKKDKILDQCENTQLSEEQKREMKELIEERVAILEG